jgi:hypothetical protein
MSNIIEIIFRHFREPTSRMEFLEEDQESENPDKTNDATDGTCDDGHGGTVVLLGWDWRFGGCGVGEEWECLGISCE